MGKILKVGLLLFVIGLIGTVTLLFSGVGFADNKVIEKQTLISNGLKKVSIHSDLADVIILPANDDEVKMELTGSTTQKLKTTFQPSDDGETLNISVKQKDKFFFNINFDFMNSNDVNLNVYLPQKNYDSLEISTNLGDISTDYKLTAKNAIIKTEMGDVQLKGFEGEKIIGKTALGEIEIKELNAAFDIQSEKGDVNLQSVLSFSNENKIKTALGDVEVGITEDPEGLALDLSTELGDIESDIFITDAIKFSGDAISNKLKGQYGKNINDGPSLTIKAEMGDITLKK